MQSVKKNTRFRYIYANGVTSADRLLVLHYLGNGLEESRFGICVSGKVGKAVVRNKIKRRLKEILRANIAAVPGGYDIIFVVRVRCADADFCEIKRSAEKLLTRVGLLTGHEGEQH